VKPTKEATLVRPDKLKLGATLTRRDWSQLLKPEKKGKTVLLKCEYRKDKTPFSQAARSITKEVTLVG
jgi:hypothetical protein